MPNSLGFVTWGQKSKTKTEVLSPSDNLRAMIVTWMTVNETQIVTKSSQNRHESRKPRIISPASHQNINRSQTEIKFCDFGAATGWVIDSSSCHVSMRGPQNKPGCNCHAHQKYGWLIDIKQVKNTSALFMMKSILIFGLGT